ncbi:MAG: hypothetical protein RMJ15_08950 [Nitrososphaerota archaeon]|nr:hypothetical protein [Nitrososphaerota archaeon]
MRPVLWGLLLSAVGFVLWMFFSFLFALAKVAGAGNAAGVFFLVTFGLLGFFSLPVGAFFEASRKMPNLRNMAYSLIAIAVICWIGALSAGIREQETNKPIIIRGVNIVKEGAYAENVFVSSIPPPAAQYGEFKLDITVAYLRPIMGPESVNVQSIYVLTSGFELKHVEPQPPFRVDSSSIKFTLTLKGPQEGFDGPITLKIILGG